MNKKSDRLVKLNEAADKLGTETDEQLDLMAGLTTQQQLITRFKMRGLTQSAIAKILEVTPARVSQEMTEIRKHYIARGSDVNQAAVVGATVSLYEEVEQRAWEVFHNDEGKKLRALDTVMTAREKQLKLLMDLGLVKRAATEHAHSVVVSPVMEQLTEQKKAELVARLIEPAPGIEPEPPDEDYIDMEEGYESQESEDED